MFREQGITITSVITALGLVIGMIINSILSAFKTTPPAPTPTPKPEPTPTPKPEPGIKGWIKEQLRNIANLLLKLADKMLIALPGIIGSVVSFVLKAASTAVGFYSRTSLDSNRCISRLIVQLCAKPEFIPEFISKSTL